MSKAEFKFEGIITPKMLKEAAKPTFAVAFKIDKPLMDAIKKANPNKTGLADYAIKAIKANLHDLDSVLLALMDESKRIQEYDIRSSMMHVTLDVSEVRKGAEDFLKIKGYTRVGAGRLTVACMLLSADAERLIPQQK